MKITYKIIATDQTETKDVDSGKVQIILNFAMVSPWDNSIFAELDLEHPEKGWLVFPP